MRIHNRINSKKEHTMKKIIKKLDSSVKKYLINYSLGLILTQGKKFCTKIAQTLGLSHDSIYRFLSQTNLLVGLFPKLQVNVANYCSKENPGWLIIDDTTISKLFSKVLEGVAWMYNSSLGRSNKGLCLVVIAWSNDLVTIPLGFKWYFRKNIAQDQYKKKIELAQELIEEFYTKVSFEYFLADGLYSSKAMYHFLCAKGIKFEMRIASNRKVVYRGINEQIKKHKFIRLRRNERSRTLSVKINGLNLYLTIQKRINRNNEYDIVYQISNINTYAKQHVKFYEQRWQIEVLFRTIKQSFGLNQCAARSLEKQNLHIYAIFFTYGFVQHQKKNLHLSNSEAAVNNLANLKLNRARERIVSYCRTFN